jgi:serine/threonine-protein kinase
VGAELFSSLSVPDPFVGRTLDGRYEVLERLGAGGVGVVYRGRQVQLGRFVAIKVLQQHAAALPEWRRRFQREAKALSALAHPNVVTVTDSGIDAGVPYLVMELLQGKTLSELVKEGPLPPARALDIVRQTLRGLAFAHGKGIVHRDLKPANVFLQALPDQADHVRLLDFGMAKFLERSASPSLVENLTRVGAVFGTPSYMSPEQGRAEAVDTRTDVYAAGVVLFELLAGRLPFAGDSYETIMKAHLLDPIPSLAEARPDLAMAPLLQPVIDRAMAKKPAARFPDAASMLAALEAIDAVARVMVASGGLAGAPKQSVAPGGKARELVSHSWRAAVTLVTLAAGVTTVVTFVRRDSAKPVESAPAAAVSPAAVTAKRTQLPPAQAGAPPAPAATPAPAGAPAHAPAATAGPAGPPARDPWQGAVPSPLRPIRDRLARGARMSERSLRPAYLFAHQNPGDPRPWLLVARAYAQLDWLSDAVDRYLRAYHADPTCRGDPEMLPDLLRAVEHPAASRGAAKAIHDIYGAEAIPAIDSAIERRAGDRDATARLTRLRESLAR